HGVHHLDPFGYDLAFGAAVLLGHGESPQDAATASAPLLPPENTFSALMMAFQARSTMEPRSACTSFTLPRLSSRASQLMVNSPTRWPRWFTNRQWPVTVENQD